MILCCYYFDYSTFCVQYAKPDYAVQYIVRLVTKPDYALQYIVHENAKPDYMCTVKRV